MKISSAWWAAELLRFAHFQLIGEIASLAVVPTHLFFILDHEADLLTYPLAEVPHLLCSFKRHIIQCNHLVFHGFGIVCSYILVAFSKGQVGASDRYGVRFHRRSAPPRVCERV